MIHIEKIRTLDLLIQLTCCYQFASHRKASKFFTAPLLYSQTDLFIDINSDRIAFLPGTLHSFPSTLSYIYLLLLFFPVSFPSPKESLTIPFSTAPP